MKKATRYLKQLFSAVVAAVKSTAAGTKSSSLRTRLVMLSIMRNKKLLLSAIQTKIYAIMGGAAAAGGSGQGGYAINAVATTSHGGGEGVAGEHLLLGGGGGGGRKAAVLQSLPSFVVEQESRAVVLSSLPSFALERDAGGRSPLAAAGGEEAEYDDGDGEKQAAICAATAPAEGGFRLEDEIDRVADVFIRRFHDQMKLQKLESFKRFCEMLERGA
ncbi:hypothetical protein HU200_041851 [Digitaria exilis]|uniref:Uncharacterized protein n=1 Tax=Digitaria exilis TaxID=1010633 RepID=A0A835B5U9_9POAL|nr:hypothetical protein HU200_041851 [Digitaria exilis]